TELPRSTRTTAPEPFAAARSSSRTRPPSVPSDPSTAPPAATIRTAGPAIWAAISASPEAISELWETRIRVTVPLPSTMAVILQCRTGFDNSSEANSIGGPRGPDSQGSRGAPGAARPERPLRAGGPREDHRPWTAANPAGSRARRAASRHRQVPTRPAAPPAREQLPRPERAALAL